MLLFKDIILTMVVFLHCLISDTSISANQKLGILQWAGKDDQ